MHTFEKDGKKHTVLPLKYVSVAKGSSPKVILIIGKEFLQEIKNGEVIFSFIGKPKVILTKINLNEFPK